MSARHHLSAYDRGRAVGRLEAGQSVTTVARVMGVAKSVISRLKKAAEGGNAMRKHAGGRGRNTTPQEDRYVSLVAKRNRHLTPSQIAADLATATGTNVSARTISRRLNQVGLYARKPVQCIPLQPRHRRERSRWCKEHIGWGQQEWSRVMFSDESRFTVTSDSGHQLLWRERGTRYAPQNVQERHRYGQGVMVWAGIMHNAKTPLHIFERGTVTSQRYCREIVLDHVRLFRGAVGPDFLFMDDNARPHRTAEVSDTLESENIERMTWPAYSPDLNPIEHAWDALGRRVSQRTRPPRTMQELKIALREEWDNIPQGLLNTLVDSMKNRCKMCISVRGCHTPY